MFPDDSGMRCPDWSLEHMCLSMNHISLTGLGIGVFLIPRVLIKVQELIDLIKWHVCQQTTITVTRLSKLAH